MTIFEIKNIFLKIGIISLIIISSLSIYLVNKNRNDSERECKSIRKIAEKKREPKEKALAKKVGVSRSCLVEYEFNYDYFDKKELYKKLDKCSNEDIDKLSDYFKLHPHKHLEELPNG